MAQQRAAMLATVRLAGLRVVRGPERIDDCAHVRELQLVRGLSAGSGGKGGGRDACCLHRGPQLQNGGPELASVFLGDLAQPCLPKNREVDGPGGSPVLAALPGDQPDQSALPDVVGGRVGTLVLAAGPRQLVQQTSERPADVAVQGLRKVGGEIE
ncbi:hypothetical protein [Streptomyces sp. NPDC054854]